MPTVSRFQRTAVPLARSRYAHHGKTVNVHITPASTMKMTAAISSVDASTLLVRATNHSCPAIAWIPMLNTSAILLQSAGLKNMCAARSYLTVVSVALNIAGVPGGALNK